MAARRRFILILDPTLEELGAAGVEISNPSDLERAFLKLKDDFPVITAEISAICREVAQMSGDDSIGEAVKTGLLTLILAIEKASKRSLRPKE